MIVQDIQPDGASAHTIRKRHIQWIEHRGFGLHFGIPRFDYCLMVDGRSIRPILTSSGPENKSGLVGYVNVVDCDFDLNGPENDCSENYGSVRTRLTSIFQFALACDNLTTGVQK